jgi:hypothetical protein
MRAAAWGVSSIRAVRFPDIQAEYPCAGCRPAIQHRTDKIDPRVKSPRVMGVGGRMVPVARMERSEIRGSGCVLWRMSFFVARGIPDFAPSGLRAFFLLSQYPAAAAPRARRSAAPTRACGPMAMEWAEPNSEPSLTLWPRATRASTFSGGKYGSTTTSSGHH